MDIALKNISIELPVTDLSFMETLVHKMGWRLKSYEDKTVSAKNTSVAYDAEVKKQYSPRIMHLRSMHGSGITQRDIEEDERLSYLLNR